MLSWTETGRWPKHWWWLDQCCLYDKVVRRRYGKCWQRWCSRAARTLLPSEQRSRKMISRLTVIYRSWGWWRAQGVRIRWRPSTIWKSVTNCYWLVKDGGLTQELRGSRDSWAAPLSTHTWAMVSPMPLSKIAKWRWCMAKSKVVESSRWTSARVLLHWGEWFAARWWFWRRHLGLSTDSSWTVESI